MKLLLLICMAALTGTASAQMLTGSCDKPVLLVASAGVKTNISGEIKFGLWQNTPGSGMTLFAGLMSGISDTTIAAKNKNAYSTEQFFVEAGYKFRISRRLFSHSMVGALKGDAYFGTEVLYQASSDVLVGINYKRGIMGVCVYVHF